MLINTQHIGMTFVRYRCVRNLWAMIAYSVQILATGLALRGSNPCEGKIFHSRAHLPWGPPSLYNGYQVIPGAKRPGRGVNHPTPSTAEVKERVKLYIYCPSVPSGQVMGRTLAFTFVNYEVPHNSTAN